MMDEDKEFQEKFQAFINNATVEELERKLELANQFRQNASAEAERFRLEGKSRFFNTAANQANGHNQSYETLKKALEERGK